MSEQFGNPDLTGYNYGSISSLVLAPDRSALPRQDKEPDGAPTSLAGRIDPMEMGSGAIRRSPKDLDKMGKKAGDRQEPSEKHFAERKAEAFQVGFSHTDIIEVAQHFQLEGFTYQPRTAGTREFYQLILSSVHTSFRDQAQDIVRTLTDAVLEDDSDTLKVFDIKTRKELSEKVFGNILNELLSKLVTISKKIADYNAEDEDMVDPDLERKKAEIDEDGGVAVVFDEEDRDDEGFEIIEESVEEEEGEQGDSDIVVDGEAREENLVLGRESSRTVNSEKDIVSPHSIDAFWVQPQISEVYPDPVAAADLFSAFSAPNPALATAKRNPLNG